MFMVNTGNSDLRKHTGLFKCQNLLTSFCFGNIFKLQLSKRNFKLGTVQNARDPPMNKTLKIAVPLRSV